jgi:L-asparaginase
MKRKVLLIYTGGTIGMMQDAAGVLCPVNFKKLQLAVPELNRLPVQLSHVSFAKPIDSSNMNPEVWVNLVQLIQKNYASYDGFVVLHGSDTMAYTASALSFMIANCNKPIILTGSQLPIGVIRTDGKENLITAIEIAANYTANNTAVVPEVCIYFEYTLLRGNRSIKHNASHFDAFQSPNFPALATAGVHIEYNNLVINKTPKKATQFYTQLDSGVGVLHFFPGISKQIVLAILQSECKVIIMRTFGSGNAPNQKWLIDALQAACANNKIIINATQCIEGRVEQGKYETSSAFERMGIISAADMTLESAITKSMFLLANYPLAKFKAMFVTNRCGEVSVA